MMKGGRQCVTKVVRAMELLLYAPDNTTQPLTIPVQLGRVCHTGLGVPHLGFLPVFFFVFVIFFYK